MDNMQGVIEGLLFIAGDEGIAPDKLAEALSTDRQALDPVLEKMRRMYQEDAGRGIELVCYAGRWKLVSKEAVGEYAKKLFDVLPGETFSNAALETLAIIAYKQPVTRAQIEQIRGVNCDMIIRKLLARDLIREAGRKDAPGMPYLYEVTPTFLDSFKLDSLEDLPKLPDFEKQAGEKDLFE